MDKILTIERWPAIFLTIGSNRFGIYILKETNECNIHIQEQNFLYKCTLHI